MDIKQINNKRIWEDFVSQQTYTSPFQSWNWGEFEISLGNKFERFGIYDREQLVGLIPVKHIRAKRGKYLHVRHGPIFDFNYSNTWEEFIRFIREKSKREGYWFVRFSPLIKNDLTDKNRFKQIVAGLKDSPMHDVDAEITWILNLRRSEDEILKNMRKNTRYYIKRAERDGVEILKTQDPKYLEEFWKIYSDTVKRQKWSAYSKEYLAKEFKAFVKDDQIQLFLAKYKGEFIAGAMFLYYAGQCVYHHSGTLTRYLRIPANYLIQWESIKEAKSRGLKTYNFWGISPLAKIDGELKPKPGHPWEGLSFFKMGFGGEVRQFTHAKDLPVSKMYYLTRIFEMVEKWRRGY
jgi:peptidoglycan pentaglycine glycine transferase (the first glycine)